MTVYGRRRRFVAHGELCLRTPGVKSVCRGVCSGRTEKLVRDRVGTCEGGV